MKALLSILFFGFGLSTPFNFTLKVMRNDEEVSISRPEILAENLVLLLQSCSVNSKGYEQRNEMWEETISSGSYILVTFSGSIGASKQAQQ